MNNWASQASALSWLKSWNGKQAQRAGGIKLELAIRQQRTTLSKISNGVLDVALNPPLLWATHSPNRVRYAADPLPFTSKDVDINRSTEMKKKYELRSLNQCYTSILLVNKHTGNTEIRI